MCLCDFNFYINFRLKNKNNIVNKTPLDLCTNKVTKVLLLFSIFFI